VSESIKLVGKGLIRVHDLLFKKETVKSGTGRIITPKICSSSGELSRSSSTGSCYGKSHQRIGLNNTSVAIVN
jgi:hypothetical protein